MKFLVKAERTVALLRLESSQERPELVTVGRLYFVN